MASLLAAVSPGLATGFLSGGLMTLFEVAFWRRYGIEDVVEWRVNQIIVLSLRGEKYQPKARLAEALGMHLLHGTIIGAVIAVMSSTVFQPWVSFVWSVCLLGSMLLWFIVPFSTKSWFEGKASVRFSNRGLLISLASHIVYGLSLGVFLQTLFF